MLIVKIILCPLFFALAVIFFVSAYQLRGEKWVKWFAGNRDEHISLDKAKKIDRSKGRLSYRASIVCIILGIYTLFWC